ncbi:uncharacterized protein LOC124540159 [Vanessa cardui]|uniref:uncharacterized protein LOC124540159 n=1 Tax=Vanessa cardui TaxID=171605 RepID=UPI001F129E33|nr:uncharacterized protein LOC124540159 [Vanessa cardui]
MSGTSKRQRGKNTNDTLIQGLEQQLQAILDRLNALEDSSSNGRLSNAVAQASGSGTADVLPVLPPTPDHPESEIQPASPLPRPTEVSDSASLDMSVQPGPSVSSDTIVSEVTDRIVNAINLIPPRMRSS